MQVRPFEPQLLEQAWNVSRGVDKSYWHAINVAVKMPNLRTYSWPWTARSVGLDLSLNQPKLATGSWQHLRPSDKEHTMSKQFVGLSCCCFITYIRTSSLHQVMLMPMVICVACSAPQIGSERTRFMYALEM